MKLFYRKYGEGPPLMILHGLYGSSDNWITVAKAISSDFTVYLPDLRNHGLSPRSRVHDYTAMSSDIHELSDELGLNKFFLAGHSMGGKTAILYAVRWPEKLEGLAIADISPSPASDIRTPEYYQHLEILNAILETDVSGAATRNDAELLLAEKISSERTRGFIMKNIQRTSDNKFSWKINAPSILRNLENIMEGVARPSENYKPVTGFPVIFLKGEKSDYIPDDDRSDIFKLFPSAEIKIIPDAGHWLHTDNPDAVISSLLDLLDK